MTAAKHRKNARRIEAAILRLQGLFIKVGQLISIMTNFLPEEFREELEGLQDQVPPRPYERHRGAPARGVRRPQPDRAVRGVFARADRVGVDRPGAPRPPAQRRAGRGQGPVPRHRGDRAHRPARAAPHLHRPALVHARLGPRHHLPRDPRDGAGRARLPARGRTRSRRSRPTSPRATSRRPLPARGRRAFDRARAHHRLDGGDQDRADRQDRQPEDRSAGDRARLRRGLLPADLHRRRLSRRSAPGEPAGRAARRAGRAAHHRVPRLRRGRGRSARGCAAGWCRSCRGR